MNEKAFSIIELVIVLAILFFFTALGINSFVRRQESFEKEGEVRELVDDLKYAKQITVSTQINHELSFDFENNSYRVIDQNGEEVKVKELIDDLTLEPVDDYQEVRFTRFGAVFQSGEVIIEGDNFLRLIKIKPSGYIDVKRDNIN